MAAASAGSFDELAESYDRYRIGYADDVYDALAENGVRAGADVLDVGCGTGLVLEELHRRGCTVTGADPSEPMLARARRRVPGAAFVLARAESLPFADATFDAATCAQAFHWVDQGRALAEMARVVRPGGTIAIWWKSLMRGDPTRLLREESARDVGLEPLPEIVTEKFDVLEDSPLVDRRLRVIPWIVRMRAGDYLGYERSRARARDAYGPQLERYYARLAERLGPPDAELSLAYLHLLFIARVPSA